MGKILKVFLFVSLCFIFAFSLIIVLTVFPYYYNNIFCGYHEINLPLQLCIF